MTKKVTWIVMKDDSEIARCKTEKMARVIAHEVSGVVVKYTKE